jgi:hypothetical protein
MLAAPRRGLANSGFLIVVAGLWVSYDAGNLCLCDTNLSPAVGLSEFCRENLMAVCIMRSSLFPNTLYLPFFVVE